MPQPRGDAKHRKKNYKLRHSKLTFLCNPTRTDIDGYATDKQTPQLPHWRSTGPQWLPIPFRSHPDREARARTCSDSYTSVGTTSNVVYPATKSQSHHREAGSGEKWYAKHDYRCSCFDLSGIRCRQFPLPTALYHSFALIQIPFPKLFQANIFNHRLPSSVFDVVLSFFFLKSFLKCPFPPSPDPLPLSIRPLKSRTQPNPNSILSSPLLSFPFLFSPF